MVNSISSSLNSNMAVPLSQQNSYHSENNNIFTIKGSNFRPVSYTTPDGSMFIGFYLSVRG